MLANILKVSNKAVSLGFLVKEPVIHRQYLASVMDFSLYVYFHTLRKFRSLFIIYFCFNLSEFVKMFTVFFVCLSRQTPVIGQL